MAQAQVDTHTALHLTLIFITKPMEQMNEAINNETALIGTASQKESAYALKKVASTTSEKMLLKAQARDDADATSTSINKEDERTDDCWCGWILENSGDDYDWDNVTRQIKADPLLAKVQRWHPSSSLFIWCWSSTSHYTLSKCCLRYIRKLRIQDSV